MVGQAFGLYGHIRRNRIRSGFLLAGLFVLAYAMAYGLILVAYGLGFVAAGESPAAATGRTFLIALPFVTVGTLLWVFIGFRFNVGMIGLMSGARGIGREDNPKLYRMLENLCISRGLTVPKLAILESEALNAFASGVNEKQFTITVTTGLIASLDDAEIEAVLAHELTHIRNGDVRMMIIAVVIAGVLSLVGEIVFRMFTQGGLRFSSSSSRDERKGGGAAMLIGIAIIVASWILAIIVRLSLSRAREYLADAGAVELTKNPDAMISALLKISGRADIEGVPSGIMDMCVENDPDNSFSDLFSTHPSMTKRVQALVATAGGRLPQAMPPRPPAMADREALPQMVEARGPWGSRPPR